MLALVVVHEIVKSWTNWHDWVFIKGVEWLLDI